MFFLNADVVSRALSCAHDFWTSHCVTAVCVSTVLGMISQVLSLLLWKMFFGWLPFVEYWPRVSDCGNRSFGTRRLRCNLVTRMSTIRLPWMLGSERCPGFLLQMWCTPPPQKKEVRFNSRKTSEPSWTQLFTFQISQREFCRWNRVVGWGWFEAIICETPRETRPFRGRVLKDTIKRHVDPDDYCL